MLFAAVSVMLVYTAVGMLVAALVARPPTGPGFWRLTILLILAGFGLGMGLRLSSLSTALPHPGGASLLALGIASLALIGFGARQGGGHKRAPRLAARLGDGCGSCFDGAGSGVETGGRGKHGRVRRLRDGPTQRRHSVGVGPVGDDPGPLVPHRAAHADRATQPRARDVSSAPKASS